MTQINTHNRKETVKWGIEFGKTLKGGQVVALFGDLGAGKTTFASGIINYFIPGKRVLSPTFIIVRHYYPKNKYIEHIVHIDLYRLNNIKEIEDLGLNEFFNIPKTVVLIEWADKMKSLLPRGRTDITFEISSGDIRKIIYGKSK